MIIKDPYVDLINLMRSHGAHNNPSTIELGQVISSNPLTIKVQDLPLTKENLLVADYLLANYSREVNVLGTTTTMSYIDTLKKDDSVALIRIGAFYIVLCKVVSP